MEAEIKYESVDANRVLAMMETAGNRLNIMFLDACRDNPFSRSFRSSARGLAQMDAPSGTMVSFATAPGKTAADGDGRNGLFTSHLLKQMNQSDLELGQILKNVTRDVLRDSGGKQTPWRLSSTTGDFFFKGGSTKQAEPIRVAGGSFQQETPRTATGNLQISSTPAGARIYVNDAYEGNSPLGLSLNPGRYAVEARMKGYASQKEVIRLRTGKSLELNLVLDKIAANLWIRSQPKSARIYINNEYYGMTPDTIKDLNAGNYQVTVTKKGFMDWKQSVTLVKGEEKELNLTLMKKSQFPDMLLIPAGEFEMGSNSGDKDEKPVHRASLDPFFIDKYEVTVAQYEKCSQSGKCKKPKTGGYYNWGKSDRKNHPVNGVDWNDAVSYCSYVNKRLPTEAEWEKAATWKNGQKFKYPSGKSSVSCSDAVMRESGDWDKNGGCGKVRTWPVGSKLVEINGTYDMAGNVWEWVADWYGDYSSGHQQNPKGSSSGSFRVIRGGGWIDRASYLRGSNRSSSAPTNLSFNLGFRCAVSP